VRLATGPDGQWVVVLRAGRDHCRIRELISGEVRKVSPSTLDAENEARLHDIGQAAPGPVQPTDSAVQTVRGWGLVLVVGAASPVSVRSLLAATDECESDINGLLAELEAGGLLERTEVTGERGYELSPRGTRRVEALWSPMR
jgi:hypothetical protein